MKFRFLLISIILFSCTSNNISRYEKPVFNSKGFAYIYTVKDYENKIIKKKINSYENIIAHNKVSKGVLLKITNPKNGKNIILKNTYKLDYPDFYKILITKTISNQIGLDENFPFVEVEELKKINLLLLKKRRHMKKKNNYKLKHQLKK